MNALVYETSKEFSRDYPSLFKEKLKELGYSVDNAVTSSHAWHCDLVFGGIDDVYGCIGFFNQVGFNNFRVRMKVVVKDPTPEPQVDAVTRLLLKLPMFDNIVKGLTPTPQS